MATNAMIAMGVQPVQMRDPLVDYAKMTQIQNAQGQNAMMKYQMADLERESAGRNAMNEALRISTGNKGEIDYDKVITTLGKGGQGSMIPGVVKQRTEATSAKTKAQKEEFELVDGRLKQSREILDRIDPNAPDAPQQVMGWFAASQSDPVLQKALRGPVDQMAKQQGLTYEEYLPKFMADRKAEIEQAVAQGPQGLSKFLQRATQGNAMFTEKNKATFYQQSTGAGGHLLEVRDGKGTVVPGSEYKAEMTPAQVAANNLARQRESRMAAKPGSGGVATGAESIEPSGTSIIVTDKFGNRKLEPTKAKALLSSQKGVSNAENVLGQIDDLVERVLPNTSSSGLGRDVTEKLSYFAGSDTPVVGKTKEANDKMKSFANSALGALNSPLMKGAPSNADAVRALSVINDEDTSLENKKQAMVDLKTAIETAIDFHNEALSVYDSESLQALKGVGVQTIAKPTGKKPNASGKPSSGGKPTVSNW